MSLNRKQRRTLEAMFSHPLPRDLRWKDLLSLCEALGVQVKDKGNAAIFSLPGQPPVSAHKPHGKSTDKGTIAAVRDLLKGAGLGPGGTTTMNRREG